MIQLTSVSIEASQQGLKTSLPLFFAAKSKIPPPPLNLMKTTRGTPTLVGLTCYSVTKTFLLLLEALLDLKLLGVGGCLGVVVFGFPILNVDILIKYTCVRLIDAMVVTFKVRNCSTLCHLIIASKEPFS